MQIEAQPTLAEAEERAQAYAGAFPDVAGFRLSSGWYRHRAGPLCRRRGACAAGRAAQRTADPGRQLHRRWPQLPPAVLAGRAATRRRCPTAAPDACRRRSAPTPAPGPRSHAARGNRRAGARGRSGPGRWRPARSCRPRCNGSASTPRASTAPSAPAPATAMAAWQEANGLDADRHPDHPPARDPGRRRIGRAWRNWGWRR